MNVAAKIPNDCDLGVDTGRASSIKRLLLLTGPNASGKTVYLRTMAIVVFLAHIGSFGALTARSAAHHVQTYNVL